jgi:hypothetical protein
MTVQRHINFTSTDREVSLNVSGNIHYAIIRCIFTQHDTETTRTAEDVNLTQFNIRVNYTDLNITVPRSLGFQTGFSLFVTHAFVLLTSLLSPCIPPLLCMLSTYIYTSYIYAYICYVYIYTYVYS